MHGYVFLSTGAKATSSPEKYPARQHQIEKLSFVFSACGEDSPEIYVEKCVRVESLKSLPTLRQHLIWAVQNKSKVIIDDFRRIFYKTPFRKRRQLLEELAPFGPVFWEARYEARPLASLQRADLEELMSVDRPIPIEKSPKPDDDRSAKRRRRQTRRARLQSAKSRAAKADQLAGMLSKIRKSLQEKGEKATLKTIAEEANKLELRTAWGGAWSAASVKRMLDRAEELANDT
ncbi:hypothetical protein [Boseongicola aestuarii]|uniref:Uncharacterized protein n=1 Tax=Boseongicola aestuarii TaxID=1470561 RepID=A0A238J3V0_9RHOB|nr:hypothetical protein [Boseongicola aestuarii]SMX25287.1 hypothetical protein BOA8489_03426 [Boseongicola aestuarii]